MTALDPVDRSLVLATQAGLPLTARPYAQIAAWLMLSEDEVIARLSALQDRGIIRRIAIAPNHYALGMTANGMSVWDVDDAQAATLGAQIRAILGAACRADDILYSTRILKKTGLRLQDG